MQPTKGKRGRKVARSIKRKRYNVSFEQRYHMTRSAWVQYKKHTPRAEVHTVRLVAQQKVLY